MGRGKCKVLKSSVPLAHTVLNHSGGKRIVLFLFHPDPFGPK